MHQSRGVCSGFIEIMIIVFVLFSTVSCVFFFFFLLLLLFENMASETGAIPREEDEDEVVDGVEVVDATTKSSETGSGQSAAAAPVQTREKEGVDENENPYATERRPSLAEQVAPEVEKMKTLIPMKVVTSMHL